MRSATQQANKQDASLAIPTKASPDSTIPQSDRAAAAVAVAAHPKPDHRHLVARHGAIGIAAVAAAVRYGAR
jgi:hypothetical protein